MQRGSSVHIGLYTAHPLNATVLATLLVRLYDGYYELCYPELKSVFAELHRSPTMTALPCTIRRVELRTVAGHGDLAPIMSNLIALDRVQLVYSS